MLVYFTWPTKRPGGHQSQLTMGRSLYAYSAVTAAIRKGQTSWQAACLHKMSGGRFDPQTLNDFKNWHPLAYFKGSTKHKYGWIPPLVKEFVNCRWLCTNDFTNLTLKEYRRKTFYLRKSNPHFSKWKSSILKHQRCGFLKFQMKQTSGIFYETFNSCNSEAMHWVHLQPLAWPE